LCHLDTGAIVYRGLVGWAEDRRLRRDELVGVPEAEFHAAAVKLVVYRTPESYEIRLRIGSRMNFKVAVMRA
ncbi:MAG: hypothetical protein JWO42_348, partial [Chloroflexi bacterium]|nr:hypothetical protein [Chloroflexota bacterium]